MHFTMQGHQGTKEIEITWEDGKLSGDADAVTMIRAEAASSEGKVISSIVDSSTHNHLQNPRTVATLFRMLCTDQPVTTETDVPMLPDVPEGAVE